MNIKDKLNMLFRKYLFSDKVPLDTWLVNITGILCIAGSFATMIIWWILGVAFGFLAILVFMQVSVFLALFFFNKFPNRRLYKTIIVVLICYISLPATFFFVGGAGTSIDFYFLLCFIIIFLIEYTWRCIIYLLIQIAIISFCLYVNHVYPELIIRLSGGETFLEKIHSLDRALGFSIAGLFIGIFINLQGRFHRLEKKKSDSITRELEMAQRTTNAMLNSNPQINVLFDSSFQVVDCNPTALKYMGFSTKEELRSDFLQRMMTAIPKYQSSGRVSIPLQERMKATVMEGAVHFETELNFLGKLMILDVELKRIPYGDSFGIVGYLIDITSTRETERELHRRGKLLASVNNAATILSSGIAFEDALHQSMASLAEAADIDRIYVWHSREVNRKKTYFAIYEWMNDLGSSVQNVGQGVNPKFIEAIPEWEEKFSRGESVNGPVCTLSENEQATINQYDVISIAAVPVILENQYWGFLSFDDCHSKRIFNDSDVSILQSGSLLIASAIVRNEMTNKIRDTAARLETVIGNYSGIIWSIDKDGVVKTFKGHYLEKINIKPRYLEGKNINRHRIRSRHIDIITNVEEILADGKERDWMSEIDGGIFHNHAAPLFDVNGNVTGVMGSTDDITESIRLQNELKAAMEDAQAANRAKSDFLSNMSHEIRTPMNAIIGMTSIGKTSDDIERKNYAFGKIQDASTHLLGVINDILDMSKIEAGKFELNPVEFEFEKMLRKVSDVIMFRADEKKIKFVVRIDRNISHMIIADDQRLAQVITNLLSNAVKFTPEGGTVRLNAIFVAEEGNTITLRIEVRDSGIGISAEQQSRLFNSFQQAESGTTRKFGGTGLGLVISKRIVEMMDGSIWIESELGKGATFVFMVKAELGKRESPHQVVTGMNLSTLRVLAVDDMAEVREYFEEIGQRLNFCCDVAASGMEALELISKNGAYDINFIDLKMPGMNGLELARKLNELGSEKSVTIMISSGEWTSVEVEAREAGIFRFLSKPLFLSTIVDCINEYLGLENLKAKEEDIITKADNYEGRRILLAEDVEINREILLTLLEPTHISIDCAENGRVAVQMFSDAPDMYDMIFMDVQMPEMDGYEATLQIRQIEAECSSQLPERPKDTPESARQTPRLPESQKRIPIIAMTANVFREDIERCLQVGMDSHVGKPLTLVDVLDMLRKYL